VLCKCHSSKAVENFDKGVFETRENEEAKIGYEKRDWRSLFIYSFNYLPRTVSGPGNNMLNKTRHDPGFQEV
jgi:hypothetical protein